MGSSLSFLLPAGLPANASTLETIIAVAKDNLMLLVLIFALFVKTYVATISPIKEIEGSLVLSIKDVDDWNAKVTAAMTEDKVVVVDFYASWCPPCRTAAPIFAQMSREYEKRAVVFWKVDVDAVPTVATDQAIRAMPTFKVFKKGANGKLTETKSIEGWREGDVRAAIDQHAASVSSVVAANVAAAAAASKAADAGGSVSGKKED